MKLEEAIENIKEEVEFEEEHENQTMVNSLKLLIEAGKKEVRYRGGLPDKLIRLLPGETED